MKRSLQLLTLSALMATVQLASADIISPLPAGGEGRDDLVPAEETYTDRRSPPDGSIVSWGVSKAQHRGELPSTRRLIDD